MGLNELYLWRLTQWLSIIKGTQPEDRNVVQNQDVWRGAARPRQYFRSNNMTPGYDRHKPVLDRERYS